MDRVRSFRGPAQQLLDISLAQHAAKAADLRGVARQARLVVRHTTKELPGHILASTFSEFFIAKVEGAL